MNETAHHTVPPQSDPTSAAVAPLLESEARTWSMLVHLIAVVAQVFSGGLLGFIAPMVIWLMYRQRSALVDFHGRQNLNLQLTLLVGGITAIILSIATLGIGLVVTVPLFVIYGLYAFVISIVVAIKANNGEYYPIRVVIPFIR